MIKFRWLGLALAATLQAAGAQGSLDMRWDPGADDCAEGQGRTQAHAIDETTIAIRQSPCIDYEAPIMYLLLGSERALLIDSGVSGDPRVTAELTSLVSRYLERTGAAPLPLVVAHTHGHQDHRAGDAAFAALPGVTVVPHEGEGLRRFFGFQGWPDAEAHFDLGGREVIITPTPGHHPDHLVFLDSRTRLLFTGDFYLPGRLLVEDIDAYRASAMKMIEFVQTYRPHKALGAHVEMDADGELYGGGATYHRNEHPVALPLGVKESVELHSALMDFNGFYNRHAAYVVVNPVHNLIALAVGVIVALVLVVLGVRRFIQRRRQLVAGT